MKSSTEDGKMILLHDGVVRMNHGCRRQRGASFWQFLIVACVGGFFVLVGLRVAPLYFNELKVATAVKDVARRSDPSTSLADIRTALNRHWDIDDIEQIEPKDIRLSRGTGQGAVLSWDYDAQARLFSNVYIVINFTGSRALGERH